MRLRTLELTIDGMEVAVDEKGRPWLKSSSSGRWRRRSNDGLFPIDPVTRELARRELAGENMGVKAADRQYELARQAKGRA